MKKINLLEKCDLFTEHWSPRIIAQLNDYHLKVVRVKGDFIWHKHHDTDEVFIVLEGHLRMDYEDEQIPLSKGEMIVVPRNKLHKPYAKKETKLLVIEPAGTRNTGDISDPLTKTNPEWI